MICALSVKRPVGDAPLNRHPSHHPVSSASRVDCWQLLCLLNSPLLPLSLFHLLTFPLTRLPFCHLPGVLARHGHQHSLSSVQTEPLPAPPPPPPSTSCADPFDSCARQHGKQDRWRFQPLCCHFPVQSNYDSNSSLLRTRFSQSSAPTPDDSHQPRGSALRSPNAAARSERGASGETGARF